MQKKLTLKARQKNPDSPPELVTHYQLVVNVLDHYPDSRHYMPAITNVRDGVRSSIVDNWTMKFKKLLKKRT